ncbi:invasin, partial [Salmonella enterica subsp. enterica serovar Enteritidis]|nr:invasin [Salmonella enterica subsp. enterica serovar Enteritidis]
TSIGSDGKDTVKLTASLEDSYGNPVTGKTVAIKGADLLAGFKLSQVQDQQNGHYVATGTATTKGSVTLNAQVDGKTVGNPVTITVGAITPDLRFDNAEQPVTWTRSFTASQAVRGMPEGVEQRWSSSNTGVATVDGSGKVTLLKAGSARISVYTPGNEQYNQAMASYTLNVSKATPGLKAGTGDPITAVWADGKERNITATYTNSDVQNELTATYATKDTSVVSVDNTGKLTAVKPGTTTVTVRTPETDQFIAASADVVYVLNKATADVSFDTSLMKTTDEDVFTLQEPVTTLTSQADIKWTSSNTNVVNISGSGTVQGNISKGQTRLTLTVLANDYYNASSGYYDVMVYSKPSISLGDVSYISRGSKGSSGTWTPVFTDDTLTVTWSADASDEFSKPESVTVYLLDSNNNVLASKEEPSPSGSKTTTVNPNANLWGKT